MPQESTLWGTSKMEQAVKHALAVIAMAAFTPIFIGGGSTEAAARSSYCNVTPNPPEKPKCKNCSSELSGDFGKGDCLVRHQGDHVDFGECKPSECSQIE